MTNAQIIFNQSMALLEAGIIKSTGRTFECENENGEKVTIYEPEAIHTFKKWQEYGRQVKKGEHAKANFYIWKAGEKKGDPNEAGEQSTELKMFMKKSFFFTIDQTEPITSKA